MAKATFDEVTKCIDNAIDYAKEKYGVLLDGFIPQSNQVTYTRYKGEFNYLDLVTNVKGEDLATVFTVFDERGRSLSFIVTDYETRPIGGNLSGEPKEILINSISDSVATYLDKKNPDYAEDYSTYHFYKDVRSAKTALDAIEDLIDRHGLSQEDGRRLDNARDALLKISEMNSEPSLKGDNPFMNKHTAHLQYLRLDGSRNK